MGKGYLLFLTAIILILAVGTFVLTAGVEAQGNGADGKEDPKEQTKTCLACHGPFDELAKSTASYIMPSEEETTPHKYVPHAEPSEANINYCTNCHKPHPIPPESSEDVAKTNVDWCYTNCHHAYNFSPCSDCH